jgi:hypothetical protein
MFGSVPKPVILQLSLKVRARVERPPGDDASKMVRTLSASMWARELCHRQCVQPMQNVEEENIMGRGLLLWLIGIPIPIILLIWLFGGLH